MATEYGNGLTKIEYAPIANDGGIGTVWTELGSTFKGSAKITSAAGNTNDFFIEQQDDPFLTIKEKGKITLVFTSVDVSRTTMLALFGGAITGTGTVLDPYVYTAPDKIEAAEYSWRITDGLGKILKIVRGSMFPAFNWALTKDDVAKIDVSVDILAPTKENTKPWSITYPGVG
jgi:hypothetical protein